MIILNDYIIFSPGTRGKRVDYFCIKFHFNPQLRRICFAECFAVRFSGFQRDVQEFRVIFFLPGLFLKLQAKYSGTYAGRERAVCS